MVVEEPKELLEAYHPSSTHQVPIKYPSSNQNVLTLLNILVDKQLSVKQMLTVLGLKDRVSFVKNYLSSAIEQGLIVMLYPDSPKHPKQKYLLSEKGILALKK